MSQSPMPTNINLHQKSRVLEIEFNNGEQYKYTCHYLRCFSPSAEVQGHAPGQEVLQIGKEDVNIDKIEQVGNYAICIHFNDEHNTGIYSWETLYNLGKNYQENWDRYSARLQEAAKKRETD